MIANVSKSLILLIFLGMVGLTPAVHAQEMVPAPEQRASPLSMARAMTGDTYMKVTYSSPRKRDRDIFGGLVPLDAVWRTGANEGTELTLTDDVLFGGQAVEAGTYTIFSIPGDSEWTVILNATLNQWGSGGYDQSADVVRVSAAVQTMESVHEAFTIGLEEIEEGTVHLAIMWDQTKVEVPIVAQ